MGGGPFGKTPPLFPPRPPARTILGGLSNLSQFAPRQPDPGLDALLRLLRIPKRREIFVSYHHAGDQAYYNALAALCDDCNFLTDRSVDRLIGSDDVQYQERRIRDEFITGTSATIVLCGANSFKRKFVDWEISTTLDKQHGLIGICLPTAMSTGTGWRVPDRYYDNWRSGFAVWHHWSDLTAASLRQWIEDACARDTVLIRNGRDKMTRNAP